MVIEPIIPRLKFSVCFLSICVMFVEPVKCIEIFISDLHRVYSYQLKIIFRGDLKIFP